MPYKQEYFIVQTCSVDYPDPIFIVVLRISGQLQIQIHNVARLTLEANHIYQAPGGIVKFWAGKDAWALTLFITLRE